MSACRLKQLSSHATTTALTFHGLSLTCVRAHTVSALALTNLRRRDRVCMPEDGMFHRFSQRNMTFLRWTRDEGKNVEYFRFGFVKYL
jgi:hypothetical protein